MNINGWDALAMAVGRWVAYGYVAYATGFLMLGAMYGLHAIVLVAAAREWRRPSAGPGLGWWLIDLAYGLLNPVV